MAQRLNQIEQNEMLFNLVNQIGRLSKLVDEMHSERALHGSVGVDNNQH